MSDIHATPDEVKRLAALARITVPEERLEAFAAEFDTVLAYISKLDELSLESGTPEVSVVRNVLREDGEPHAPGLHTEKIAEQFPKREGDYLAVKQIISYE